MIKVLIVTVLQLVGVILANRCQNVRPTRDSLEIDYMVNGSPLVLNEAFFEVSNPECDPQTIGYRVETDA